MNALDTVAAIPARDDRADHIRNWWALQPDDPDAFRVREQVRTRQGYRFLAVGLDACSGERGLEEISRARDDGLYLTLYDEGELEFSARSSHLSVEAGDLLVWDPAAPGHFSCSRAVHGATIVFPRSIVERCIGNVETIYAVKSPRHDARTKLLFSHAMTLHGLSDQLDDASLEAGLESLLELLVVCLSPHATLNTRTTYRERLLTRVQGRIRERIEDKTVSPETIAQEFGLSVRRVHGLFAQTGLTFSEFVRRERLARARAVLRSKAFADVSIAEIAHRFGFFDSAHFSNTFKRYYKVSPSTFRRQG